MGDIHNLSEKWDSEKFYGLEIPNEWLEYWQDSVKQILEWRIEGGRWVDQDNPISTFRAAIEERGGWGARPQNLVFISHSHHDTQLAVNLAHDIRANKPAYDIWLDIWDPMLININQSQLSAARKVLMIALAIEMGLLASTHLVALCTKASVGSSWIPYEYGRVKPKTLFATEIAAFIPAGNGPTYEPEYLDLGMKFRNQQKVFEWL